MQQNMQKSDPKMQQENKQQVIMQRSLFMFDIEIYEYIFNNVFTVHSFNFFPQYVQLRILLF